MTRHNMQLPRVFADLLHQSGNLFVSVDTEQRPCPCRGRYRGPETATAEHCGPYTR